MRNLTVEDSGTYQCGVDIKVKIDKYKPVRLNVKEDRYYGKSINETDYIGGTVNISCNYPESHRRDPKFLCKTVGTAVCTYKTSVKESGRWIREGHMSLYDDGTKHILTVTIRHVTGQDSGQYWCGVESDWKSEQGYNIYIRQIYLRVTGVYPVTPLVQLSTWSAHHSPSPAPSIQPEHRDSPPAFPGLAMYSSIAVSLVLVIAGVITAIYCKIKRKEPETVTQSREINEDYVNILTISAFQQQQKKQSESVYQNFSLKCNH
ncbi:polymeric immunoglobulin receptor-like [Electrophorus electricus]|uniref:polymeric immunoglobulin receptor-like n=1 Tax=Electrophorus electricus TaxID=8005 RepID=UPI0015D073E0|nr:polymeric immunoglobulin receptor-like [Electrophorus electricus]